MKKFSYGYLSSLCIELHLIVKAGIPLEEGVKMLSEDDRAKDTGAVLGKAAEYMGQGEEFHDALRMTGRFPSYMCDMLEIGAKTGYQEEVFRALSEYYESQEQISRSIRSAVAYPSILIVMLLFVVTILVTRVLPIFSEVYAQLGAEMPAFAAFIMGAGEWLGRNWSAAAVLLAALAGFAAAAVRLPAFRKKIFPGGKRQNSLGVKIAAARFAFALSMTMQSGLDTDESLGMAEKLSDSPYMGGRVKQARDLIASGTSFAGAVEQSGIFPPVYSRMLEIGVRTGNTDAVMAEIARRCEDAATEDIDRLIGRIEPTLVIVMSAVVGAILLSVMLPLTGIMSAI